MSENATYFFDSDVRDYQCDLNGDMKLSNLMKVIQKIGTDQLESLGITYDKLYASGIVFVLSKLGLKINRMPKANEKFLLRTTPQKCKGASFLRHTAMFSTAGEQLVECQTSWVIINPHDRKILRPAQFKFSLPCDDCEKTGIQVLETRIKPSENVEFAGIKEVKYSDLDVNRHMNNTVYGDVVMDFVPIEVATNKEIDTVFIHYQSEALFGEKIYINTDRLSENSYYVGGNKNEVKCFEAVISFKK
ncbi:MAG: thioesterase [Oscillospiraceae bacterium]